MQIARDFNLEADNPKSAGTKKSGGSAKKAPKAAAQPALSREQAAQRAKERLAGVQLPLAADGGVAVHRWGRYTGAVRKGDQIVPQPK